MGRPDGDRGRRGVSSAPMAPAPPKGVILHARKKAKTGTTKTTAKAAFRGPGANLPPAPVHDSSASWKTDLCLTGNDFRSALRVRGTNPLPQTLPPPPPSPGGCTTAILYGYGRRSLTAPDPPFPHTFLRGVGPGRGGSGPVRWPPKPWPQLLNPPPPY